MRGPDAALGPLALVPWSQGFDDQPVHAALALSIAAVVNAEVIRKNADRVPARDRSFARNVKGARIRPGCLVLVPDVLVLSPRAAHTGMYGALWEPLGLGGDIVTSPIRLGLEAAIDVAYVFIHSDVLPPVTDL